MAHRPISSLPLEPALKEMLLHARVETAAQLLSAGALEVSDLLDIAPSTANDILAAVAAAVMQQNIDTVWQLHCSTRHLPMHLPTFMPEVDDALRGGVACSRITELVGPAGVGKTQFCLQLALSAASRGFDDNSSVSIHRRRVVYLDTEGKFSSTRMYQIAAQRFPHLATPALLDPILSNISVLRVNDSRDLLRRVQELENALSSGSIGLILLDSIAAAVRPDFGVAQTLQRQQLLGQLASMCKHYAETYRVPVVITNQITTAIRGTAGHQAGGQQQGQQSALIASLGGVWAHAVNARIVLESALEGSCRALKLVKSPDCPAALLYYQVTAAGLKVIPTPEGLEALETGDAFGNVLGMAIGNTVYNSI